MYKTHRPSCPGTFSSKCSDHLVDGEIALPETATDENKEATIKFLEEQLKELKIGSDHPKTPTSEKAAPVPPTDAPPLIPGHPFPPPHAQGQTPRQSQPQQPNNGQHPTPDTRQPDLQNIEMLVRDHIARNQQYLQSQNPAQGPYIGPTMAEIRQDPAVQSQANVLMDSIKAALPVFGQQTAGATPLSASITGINPLNQVPQTPLQAPTAQQTSLQTPQLQNLLAQLGQLLTPQPTPPPQPPQTSQLPDSVLSSLSQLGPAAAPILQYLQNLPLAQTQPQWGLQHPQSQWGQLGQQQAQTHSLVPPAPALQAPPYQNNYFGQQFQQQQQTNFLGYPPLQQPQMTPQQTLQQLTNLLPQTQNKQAITSYTGVTVTRPTEYTKFCQVDYAKKAKADNCNLVLYVWSYVAQILASKQGAISAMSDQELVGRLQHLLHILELCAMQSSASDFNDAAWLCARNYSDRLFQDLDSGATTWAHIGPKMHPTNMMQSMCTHPKVVKQEKVKQTPLASSDPPSTPAQVCPKWSTCETEDKCQYEVDNPGRTCNRPHFCIFCFRKFKQTRKHKETDCRKKLEQAGSGNNQPTS